MDALPEQKRVVGGLRPLYFYLIVLLVFVADQMSKAWITRTMAYFTSQPIIGRAFMLTLTQNTGGAWGLLPSGNKIFVLFASVAIVAILYAYHRIARADLLVGSAFALALGGAIGNLVDRLRFGYVVDFFDARFIRWPIFNVADSAISLGIVLLLVHYLMSMRADSNAQSERQPAASAPSLATEDLGKNARE